MGTRKYGVVYTPDSLASFVAKLLFDQSKKCNLDIHSILDPACGECALLNAAMNYFGGDVDYLGIDVDRDVLSNANPEIEILINDTILPRNVKRNTTEYWKRKLPPIQAIIANPPWSSEKIYDSSDLGKAGFKLIEGQYDSYVLFLELAYGILEEGGLFAFIIPDSIFDSQNERLREFLLLNTEIKVIARLGEKIFAEVNRAATVIVCQKGKPNETSLTKCFRLSTNDRKNFLAGRSTLQHFFDLNNHEVMQSRFLSNTGHMFDVDTRSNEEELLAKIKTDSVDWDTLFVFGRGVEISKHGKVVYCTKCGFAQGYKKAQIKAGKKVCTHCGEEIKVNSETVQSVVLKSKVEGSVPIFIGENIHRYDISNGSYILPNIEGIDYKNTTLYEPPKILIRKTGLGICAAIDYSGGMTTQTVYIFKYRDLQNTVPLEYYLALINSRVVYYFYLKVYGENEWKSYPYLTKKIVFSLPLKEYEGSKLDSRIVELAKEIMGNYTYKKDIELERAIMEKYGLSREEQNMIFEEMNSLPDLGAINNMKVKEIDYV